MTSEEPDLTKIILKSRKLYRMAQEKTNEGEIAQRYLDSLKVKYHITDMMIFPIEKIEVYKHNKQEQLSYGKEVLITRIGTLCGNIVIIDESEQYYIFSYKGNTITTNKSNKIIKYIEGFVDDMHDELIKSLNLKEVDHESFKIGLIAKTVEYLESKITPVKLVEEPVNNKDITKEDIENGRKLVSGVHKLRKLFDRNYAKAAGDTLNDLYLLPISRYTNEVIDE